MSISQPHQELLVTLSKIGVSGAAVTLYKNLLENSTINFSELARKQNISRPLLYRLITELEEADLVSFNKAVGGNNRLQLHAPTTVLQKIRNQKKEIEHVEESFAQILPELMDQFQQGSQPSKIKIMMGSEAFVKFLFSIADEESKAYEFFGSIKDFVQFISWETEHKWLKKRVTNGIKMRALMLPSEECRFMQRKDKEQLRESRVYLADEVFETSFQLFANKTVFWQPVACQAIVIEDQYITNMLRSMFYSLWDKAS